MMDPLSSAAIFGLVTAIATYLVAFAYMNTKFVLKHKVSLLTVWVRKGFIYFTVTHFYTWLILYIICYWLYDT